MKPPFADFYLHWLRAESFDVPQERGLNCQSCLMVNPQGLTRDIGPFRENLKCCTHFPFLPNFTIGALLASQHGAVQMQRALSTGIATPLGVFSPSAAKKEDFGQDPDRLCPLFDSETRGCSIWSHRPGVCSSYVCKSSKGIEGFGAWAALEEKLNLFEWTLAHEVVWLLGFTQDETVRIATQVTGNLKKSGALEARATWFEHADHQEQFYRSCFEKALSVTPIEMSFLMG